MLKNETEFINKLYLQAKIFKHHMIKKEYLDAALCADHASIIANIAKVDEKIIQEIFGDRQPEVPIEGLINEDQYIKAAWWCVMNGYEYTRFTYETAIKMLKNGA